MVSLGRKTLFEDKPRFAMTALGVALAIMLILLLDGMYVGVVRQITAYLDAVGPDLVVGQKDSRNFLGARSVVPAEDIGAVASTSGVRRAVPVIVQYVVLDLGGRKEFSLMIGFDRRMGGGPWQMREGRSLISDDEVIFDAVVARRHGTRVGDRILIMGRRLRVAGLSGGTSSWMTGTFFVTYRTAASLLSARENPSFLLVSLRPDVRVSQVEARIERGTGLSATPRSEVDANDVDLYARVLSGPLKLMVAVAFLVGVALVGITSYTATLERTKEYAALKAIGMANVRLYLVVLEQALISSLAGFATGVVLAFAAQWLLAQYAPQFLVTVRPVAIAALLGTTLVMGSLASLVPARAVARIDPVLAFRRGA